MPESDAKKRTGERGGERGSLRLRGMLTKTNRLSRAKLVTAVLCGSASLAHNKPTPSISVHRWRNIASLRYGITYAITDCYYQLITEL